MEDVFTFPETAVATRDEMLSYYREMTIIRRMEDASFAMYRDKLIRGFLHLYNGQVVTSYGNWLIIALCLYYLLCKMMRDQCSRNFAPKVNLRSNQ